MPFAASLGPWPTDPALLTVQHSLDVFTACKHLDLKMLVEHLDEGGEFLNPNYFNEKSQKAFSGDCELGFSPLQVSTYGARSRSPSSSAQTEWYSPSCAGGLFPPDSGQ